MINNDTQSQLGRYFANRDSVGGTGLGDMIGRLKAKRDAIQGKTTDKPAETNAAETEATAEKTSGRSHLQRYFDRRDGVPASAKGSGDSGRAAGEEENLTPMQKREKELKAIMDRLNAQEAERWGDRFDKSGSAAAGEAVAVDDSGELSGIKGFLNDMPLFEEFKSGLMKAFEMLDSASAGFLNAQYELNYSTMQYVANAAGGYDYQETTVSVKLDLNYVKAAAGGQTGKQLSEAVGASTDFASLIANLQNAGRSSAAQSLSPRDLMASLKDYWSPEATAGRIVDFCTAFFPMSDAFKKGGDVEESRAEFAEMMRAAVQKGFDQAMGKLGKVPRATQDGIDKTHELVMKGIDDFVKNGLDGEKKDVYSALERFAMSFEVSYSRKTVSVGGGTYGGQGAADGARSAAVDTRA